MLPGCGFEGLEDTAAGCWGCSRLTGRVSESASGCVLAASQTGLSVPYGGYDWAEVKLV